MRIGIMDRHQLQHNGGVTVYTRELLSKMFVLDSPHQFILLYRNPECLGTYSGYDNVKEIVLESSSNIFWDQVAVKKAEKEQGIDIIFNPKYSIPITIKCPSVFVCHGLDWFINPSWSKIKDRISHRYIVPRYAKKADAIIAVSNTTKEHIINYLKVPSEKIFTVYHGVDAVFKKPISQKNQEKIRHNYHLPERFFLYIGQIYPPKNFGRLLQAYAKIGPKSGVHLVVAGERRWLCEKECEFIDKLNISSWVVRPGWIDHKNLPGFYSLAEALLLPSLYESFGMPLVEAMSVGCPVLTSDRYGTKEIVGKGGILINPENVESIANGMLEILTNSMLRKDLIREGKERASKFTWEKCARETLDVLEKIAS